MSGYNRVIIVGRLGQNPELKYTQAGTAVANFSVATSTKYKDKSGQFQESTTWHKVVVWGKMGELCSQYLTKGSLALVEGEIQTRSWQDKDGRTNYTTEVIAGKVQFLDKKGQSAEVTSSSSQQEGKAWTEDDIPF